MNRKRWSSGRHDSNCKWHCQESYLPSRRSLSYEYNVREKKKGNYILLEQNYTLHKAKDMRKWEELKSHWKSNHLLSRLRNPFKQWNFTVFKAVLVIPQNKNHLSGLGVPWTQASIWYLGFAKLSSVFTTSDTNLLLLVPSLLTDDI